MIFRSPYPEIELPGVALTPFVLAGARARGDKPALIDAVSGRTITYRQLFDSVERVAAGLSARGFGKGDVFAIYSPNLPEYAVAFHAVSLIGGTLTTLNPIYKSKRRRINSKTRARDICSLSLRCSTKRRRPPHALKSRNFRLRRSGGRDAFRALYDGRARA